MVHPVGLMPANLISPLPVQVIFHLFSHVAPPAIFVVAALPSSFCATLILFRVSPSTHATPSLLPLPLRDSHVTLVPIFFYSHSFFLYQWICSELAAFLFLNVIDNLPLAVFAHWYACLCYWC